MAGKAVRISRKDAQGMDELISMYIRTMKLRDGINSRRIHAAWDEVTGAASHTLRRYFRDGTLYVTVASSMVRSHLYFQKDIIVQRMNEILSRDPMFDGGEAPVKKLVLK